MANFTAAFAALFLTTAIPAVSMLISTEAQANGGCSKERALKGACGKHPDKGGGKLKTIILEKEVRGSREVSVPTCLWVNYKKLREFPKYQYEGRPTSWFPKVDEKDLVARCPNRSFAQTAIPVAQALTIRMKMTEK
jgi:hypothetical protein